MKLKSFFSWPLLLFALLAMLWSCNGAAEQTNEDAMEPPVAEKKPKELTAHSHTRVDNYYWLNERENPDVIAYLEAENAYTKAMLKHTETLQDSLYEEMVGRIKPTDESVPYHKNGYYYYSRYEDGQEYPIYCRKKGSLEAEEEVMLNVNELAKGTAYCHVGGMAVSPDNKMLAYAMDTVSRRIYQVYFKNLETGETSEEVILHTTGNITWAMDNKTLFYGVQDDALRSYQIYTHQLGASVENDHLVFTEDDETFSCFVYRTKSDKFVVIGSSSTMSNEYRFVDAQQPNQPFTVFQPRERGLEYSIGHIGNKFYIRTNLDAKNFRLMETPDTKTTKTNWTEVIPHREDVLLENFELFKDFLVVDERKNGLTQLRIIRHNDQSEHYLDFGEETYTAWISTNPEFDTPVLRYRYSSLTTPTSTFDYNMETRDKELKKQQEVLGGFNPEDYEAKRLYATAEDGTKVPISLVYKKGMEKDGNNPLLLYAYGSYGSSTEAYFSSVRLSLLNRGFVYAIAHVRGGEELGRDWYEDGKLLKKKNTFTDFNDCAEYLIEQKYTKPGKLFAMGGSAGGLLMGVIVNSRPDLYKGVVAAVPFVDVVTTMLDETIPLTTSEYDEWGNPNDKTYYDYMLSYSPYDNVTAQDYPAMLVTTGLHDSQVQYWEPAKWVAKLRDMKTDNNMLLLHTNMEAGHGGASGRFQRYRETALEYAFILNLLEINE